MHSRCSSFAAGAALSVALLAARAAPAQPAAAPAQPAASAAPAATPAAPQPVLVPPRPLTPLRADYPEGAEGDAVVVLVLTVNADGTIRSSRVGEGAEPFASAALAAASSYRFEPATRDGVPVASLIRVEVRFLAPVPEPAPPPAPPAPAPAPSGPAKSGQPAPPAPRPVEPLEVTVRGEVPAPGVSSLSRAEVRLLPGAFGDPFRAIETLPGVTPIASGLPYFYVRGAPPGNVGYFLDGIRIPLLYHVGLGPSVVHPGIVDRVDLYPGGYPARYGRFAGGIVAGETKEPVPGVHGEGVLRLFDVGALAEAPFAGGRGAALVGGRYSYTAAMLSLIAPEVSLAYWDYQGRIGYDVTPHDRVTLFAFGSYDFLGEHNEYEDTTRIIVATTFHRLDLRHEHRYSAGSSLRSAVTLGYDVTTLEQGREVFDRMIGARTALDHRLADGTPIRAGLDVIIDDNGADLFRDGDGDGGIGDGDIDDGGDDGDDTDEFASLFSNRIDVAVGGYVDAELDVTRRLQVTPGLRLDLFASAGAVKLAVDPRISARLKLTPNLRLVQAHGLASQPPSFVLPGPGFKPALSGGLQRSFQSSVGLEADLPEDITAKVTLFHNAFFAMTDALGTSSISGGDTVSFDERALGSSTGMELSVHRRLTRRLGGYLAYTLSRSSRSFKQYRLPSSFDRTHVMNLAASYDFGRGYKAGGRIVFYTGIPQKNYLADGTTLSGTRRLSPFFRIDGRLEKKWNVGEAGWLSVVLEVLNATLSKEVLSEECYEGYCREEAIGPVTIPSLGLEGGF